MEYSFRYVCVRFSRPSLVPRRRFPVGPHISSAVHVCQVTPPVTDSKSFGKIVIIVVLQVIVRNTPVSNATSLMCPPPLHTLYKVFNLFTVALLLSMSCFRSSSYATFFFRKKFIR